MALCVLGGFLILGADKPDATKVLRAERFELVGRDGNEYASIDCGEDGGVLSLHNAKFDRSILLDAGSKSGASISVSGSRSRSAVLSADDTPSLRLSRARQSINVAIVQDPQIWFSDSEGRTRFIASLIKNTPSVSLWDEKQPRLTLGFVDLVRNLDGGTEFRPESSLVLFDKEGKVLTLMPR